MNIPTKTFLTNQFSESTQACFSIIVGKIRTDPGESGLGSRLRFSGCHCCQTTLFLHPPPLLLLPPIPSSPTPFHLSLNPPPAAGDVSGLWSWWTQLLTRPNFMVLLHLQEPGSVLSRWNEKSGNHQIVSG